MTAKKPIPVKYFYYGMLLCVFCIGAVFFFLWQRESNQEQLLQENGIETEAWVTRLYQSKSSKKARPIYYMDIAFFKDTLKHDMPTVTESANQTPKTGDELVAALAKQTESLHQPLGDYETQTITIPNYEVYKTYAVNDRVKIVFLKEDPSIIRLK